MTIGLSNTETTVYETPYPGAGKWCLPACGGSHGGQSAAVDDVLAAGEIAGAPGPGRRRARRLRLGARTGQGDAEALGELAPGGVGAVLVGQSAVTPARRQVNGLLSRAASRPSGLSRNGSCTFWLRSGSPRRGAGADLRSVMRIQRRGDHHGSGEEDERHLGRDRGPGDSGDQGCDQVPDRLDGGEQPEGRAAQRAQSRCRSAHDSAGSRYPSAWAMSFLRPPARTRSSPACTACAAPAECSRGSRLHANTPAAAPR
jgi:hypothetical protein